MLLHLGLGLKTEEHALGGAGVEWEEAKTNWNSKAQPEPVQTKENPHLSPTTFMPPTSGTWGPAGKPHTLAQDPKELMGVIPQEPEEPQAWLKRQHHGPADQ